MIDLCPPGSAEYAAGTSPHNSSGEQHPAYVAHPLGADDVADVVGEADRRGLRVVPQASGHGAGGFRSILEAIAPADIGRGVASSADGRIVAPDALDAEAMARVRGIRDTLDPDHLSADTRITREGSCGGG